MKAWDYALARALRDLPKGQIPALVEGAVVSAAPLTVSLYGGEVMAPPAPLQVLFCAQGFYRDKDNGHVYLETWRAGDRVLCGWMGKTVVILGRLAEPGEQIKVR